MDYAVYHTEKGNSSSGGIGSHIDREPGAEHTYRHADPNRLHLNKIFEVPEGRQNMKLAEAIVDRIEKGYKGQKAIRKDAVKYQTHVLTGSHEQMKKIFSDEKTAQRWIEKNRDWLEKQYGKENIVRFNLHLDEKTPHIQAVTVPLTSDGRLSAKEVMGNKMVMQLRQDSYAEAMKEFGLERGKRSTGIKHESAREFYGRMEKALENGNDISNLEAVKGGFFGSKSLDKEKTIEKLKIAVIEEKTAKTMLLGEVKRTKEHLATIYSIQENTKKEAEKAKQKNAQMISNRKVYESNRQEHLFKKVDEKFMHRLHDICQYRLEEHGKQLNDSEEMQNFYRDTAIELIEKYFPEEAGEIVGNEKVRKKLQENMAKGHKKEIEKMERRKSQEQSYGNLPRRKTEEEKNQGRGFGR